MAFDERWEQTHQTRIWGQYPNEQFTFFMQRLGLYNREDRKNFQLLDIGCGQGANTWLQARDGYAVTALDCSQSALFRLYSRLKDENIGAQLVRADFHEPLPFPDDGFDAVGDIHAICYGTREQVAAAIGEVHRILKPGGKFFCEMPRAGCPNEPFTQHGACYFATHADICEFFHGFHEYGCMHTTRTDMHKNPSELPFLDWWTVEARKRA